MKTFFPQQAYENKEGLPLHQYGPLLPFHDSFIHQRSTVKYVGECVNLGHRFNTGNGKISPRNCHVGGQPTNFRINHQIYEVVMKIPRSSCISMRQMTGSRSRGYWLKSWTPNGTSRGGSTGLQTERSTKGQGAVSQNHPMYGVAYHETRPAETKF